MANSGIGHVPPVDTCDSLKIPRLLLKYGFAAREEEYCTPTRFHFKQGVLVCCVERRVLAAWLRKEQIGMASSRRFNRDASI